MMTSHLNFKTRCSDKHSFNFNQGQFVYYKYELGTFFTIVAEDSTVLSQKPIAIGGGRESLENIR